MTAKKTETNATLCSAITDAGTPCKNYALDGETTCGVHLAKPEKLDKKMERAARKQAKQAAREQRDATKDQKERRKGLQQQVHVQVKMDEVAAKKLQKEAKAIMDRSKRRREFEHELKEHADFVATVAPQMGFDPDRPLVEMPELPPNHEQLELTAYNNDMGYVRIIKNKETNQLLYQVLEPKLTEAEQAAFDFLRDTLIRTMDGRHGEDQGVREYLRQAVIEAIRDHSVLIDDIGTERVNYHLERDFLGFGMIDVLMHDTQLEDISCDGPGIPLYLFHRQYESIKTDVIFPDDAILDGFVIRLGQQSGKHISIANPLLDATLPDGSRLQATLSKEVTTRGSSFTIRKFRAEPLSPVDLMDYGTFSPALAGYFWLVMEHGMSILLAGGTASGKTTSLNAACQFIPPQKKIVSIEDTREINLQHENWIAGITRTGFGTPGEGGLHAGTIDMYALLGAALRQRPEYLLVGEVRGPEALTLFQAMATGHAVYSTMHADSVASAVYRLENKPISVPRLMLQTLDVVAIQTQVRIGDRMARRIGELTEVVGFDGESGDLLTNQVFEWIPGTDKQEYLGKSYVIEHIAERQNRSEEDVEREWEERLRVLQWMQRNGIRHYIAVADVVARYYRDPKGVMEEVAADEQKCDVHPRLHRTVIEG